MGILLCTACWQSEYTRGVKYLYQCCLYTYESIVSWSQLTKAKHCMFLHLRTTYFECNSLAKKGCILLRMLWLRKSEQPKQLLSFGTFNLKKLWWTTCYSDTKRVKPVWADLVRYWPMASRGEETCDYVYTLKLEHHSKKRVWDAKMDL